VIGGIPVSGAPISGTLLSLDGVTALSWHPTFPDRIPLPRRLLPSVQPSLFLNSLPIPNPPPPVDSTWQPKYPNQLTRRTLLPSLRQFYASGTPFLGTQLQARAFFPNQVLARRRLIPSGSTFEIGGVLNVPKVGGWRPTYPNQLRRAPRANVGISVWLVDPTTLMTAAPCIEWTDETLTPPMFSDETLINPTLSDETFTSPTLSEEDLC
jgi:hypothetical protein